MGRVGQGGIGCEVYSAARQVQSAKTIPPGNDGVKVGDKARLGARAVERKKSKYSVRMLCIICYGVIGNKRKDVVIK